MKIKSNNKFYNLMADILERIEAGNVQRKQFMTVSEMAKYTGWSESQVYKLTSNNKVPFYRPHGKTVFFKKSEIDEWIFNSRVEPHDQFLNKVLCDLNEGMISSNNINKKKQSKIDKL